MLALALALLAPAAAKAAFSAPLTFSGSGQDAFDPQVAVDGNGNALAVWRRSDGTRFRAQARQISSSGVPGNVETLSGPAYDGLDAQVAIDPDGDAIVAWRRFGGGDALIEARQIDTFGSFIVAGPKLTLTPAGTFALPPQVAIDAGGDAIVTWSENLSGSVQSRSISAAGVVGPIQTVSGADQEAFLPDVAMTPAGDAVVAWYGRPSGAGNLRVRARQVFASGALGPLRTLSGGGHDARLPRVGVDADGDAAVVWEFFDGIDQRVQARQMSSTAALGPVQTLSASGANAFDPELGVDITGDATIVWSRADRVQARQMSSTGFLGPVSTLSSAGQLAGSADVGVDAGGNAIAVWTRSDGTNIRIQTRPISSAGVVGGAQTLSAAGASAGSPAVGVNAIGDAAAVWHRPDAGTFRIQISRGP